MKIKAILLDKDGTLIEFEKTWHRVFQNIFRELKQRWELPSETVETLKDLSGVTAEGFEKESLIQYAPVEEIIDRWMEVLNRVEENPRGKKQITKERLQALMEEQSKGPDAAVVPLDNTVETVQRLHHRGFILGVATADSFASTEHNLGALGIRRYFSFIGSDDGCFKGKPDPHMGQAFCERFHLHPGEVLYIGDSVTDMLFAENAGFHFIGIKGEHNEYERFLENQYPVVNNIGEIEEKIPAGE